MSTSLYICLISFAGCYFAARRSLVNGLAAVLTVGYAYGITRANLPETYSHFIFDAGVLGLYAAQLFRKLDAKAHYKLSGLQPWLELLILWPCLLFIIPIQDFAIQLVGLRGNIFLLPFIILGARLEDDDRYRLAIWVSILNLAALIFGGAEYFWGVERFFPQNKVTEIIYLSKDLVSHTAYRIPATFVNAHAYGGTMAATLPLLIGALMQERKAEWHKLLFSSALGASMLGVLMCGARLTFVIAFTMIIVAIFSIRKRLAYVSGWFLLLATIGWVASSETRLQRFLELRNTAAIAERVSWSVNMSFLEIMGEYPFGNGLGGGGTSIPYFLQGLIINPVAIENEYGRIVLEQGVLGLLIWVAFIIWLLTRKNQNINNTWYVGRRIAWLTCAASFASGMLGMGIFTSVPQSALMLLLVGWIGARQPRTEPVLAASSYTQPKKRTPVEATS